MAEYIYEYIEGKNDILKGELIRCKDCKHWAMHSWCSRLAPFDKVYMGDNDYCSKGKRREDDGIH